MLRKISYIISSILCVVGVALILCVVGGFITVLGWRQSAFEVGPDEANAHIHQKFKIPKTAKSVSYDSTPRLTRVTFKVARREFEAWAKDRDFPTRLLAPNELASHFVFIGDRQFIFKNFDDGIIFGKQKPCGILGTYNFEDDSCAAIYMCR